LSEARQAVKSVMSPLLAELRSARPGRVEDPAHTVLAGLPLA
jgi:hypothetical protein